MYYPPNLGEKGMFPAAYWGRRDDFSLPPEEPPPRLQRKLV